MHAKLYPMNDFKLSFLLKIKILLSCLFIFSFLLFLSVLALVAVSLHQLYSLITSFVMLSNQVKITIEYVRKYRESIKNKIRVASFVLCFTFNVSQMDTAFTICKQGKYPFYLGRIQEQAYTSCLLV